MKQNKYFIIGILLSIILHSIIFLAFNINIKPQIHPKDVVYIKTIHINPPATKSPTEKSITKHYKIIKPSKYQKNYNYKNSSSIDYNKTIPSFKDISTNIYNKPKPMKLKPSKPTPKTPPKPKPSKPKKPQNNKPTKPTKPSISYKHIDIIGYSADLIDYLERVFRYIHQNCKGDGILEVNLYRDGTMNMKVLDKNPVCPDNLQAPPMPDSVMENKIDFLIKIP